MQPIKLIAALSPLLAALAFAPGAVAQAPQAEAVMPSIEMESTSLNVGIGGQSGAGVLRLPNLGTNCSYPFKVNGFGAGIRVGISKASASGIVANMTKVSDFGGNYSATEGEATLIAGAGSTSMKNQNNNVIIGLRSQTTGLALGVGGQGMTIEVAEPPPDPRRNYFLTFGFNKTNVNQESRAALDQVARAWKCRYVKVLLQGSSDTVGKETSNLNLSEQRALAVRDYLLRLGFAPNRLVVQPQGETKPFIATGKNERLRNNRNVVVLIQE